MLYLIVFYFTYNIYFQILQHVLYIGHERQIINAFLHCLKELTFIVKFLPAVHIF